MSFVGVKLISLNTGKLFSDCNNLRAMLNCDDLDALCQSATIALVW